MMTVNHLSFSYKNHKVLHDVSFSITEPEVVCLLGENGAGKTTLFKCLLGFFKNYQGEILLDGDSIKNLSPRNLAKRIAYIPQSHEPTYNYNVSDIVLMGTTAMLDTYHTPSKKEEQIALESLERLGITHLASRGYAELSGGEQQLILIARAVAQKSKLLIMDEPTASLDYGNQQRVMQQVKSLSQAGYSILLSTHNPEHALHYADRIFILEKEKYLLTGTPTEMITTDCIKKIYGIHAEVLSVQTSAREMPMIVPIIE